MKKRLKQMVDGLDIGFDAAVELMKSKLSLDMYSKFGPDYWIDEEGQEILSNAFDVPELVPKYYKAFVLKAAPNGRKIVYAFIHETNKKVPVFIPSRWAKKLLKKDILVEMISDINGETYRYVRQ